MSHAYYIRVVTRKQCLPCCHVMGHAGLSIIGLELISWTTGHQHQAQSAQKLQHIGHKMSGSPLELRRSASYQSSHGKLSVESSTSTRPSSTVSGGSSYYRGLQLDAEIEAGNQPSPVLRSSHIMHSYLQRLILFYRVATWCCDDIASQADSLDIMLFNEGNPIDIMLLQSTQGPSPLIGSTKNICLFYNNQI